MLFPGRPFLLSLLQRPRWLREQNTRRKMRKIARLMSDQDTPFSKVYAETVAVTVALDVASIERAGEAQDANGDHGIAQVPAGPDAGLYGGQTLQAHLPG
jgi:hypothetical protein